MLLEQLQQSWHNMAEKTYYWIGRGEFGGGDDAVKFGEKMPKNLDKDQIKIYLEKDWISETVQVSERKLSEFESVKKELAELKKKGGSGITQEQLDTAKGESVQADLDKIKDLEDQLEEATKPKVKK